MTTYGRWKQMWRDWGESRATWVGNRTGETGPGSNADYRLLLLLVKFISMVG